MDEGLLAYAMHDLGDGWRRNESVERNELLNSGGLISVPLIFTFNSYNDDRNELILEFEKMDKSKRIFEFYNPEITNRFLEELEVRGISGLEALWGKRIFEGFFCEKNLAWISTYDFEGRSLDQIVQDYQAVHESNLSFVGEVNEELLSLRRRDSEKSPLVQGMESYFVKESDNLQRIAFLISKKGLGSLNLIQLKDHKRKLENEFYRNMNLIADHAQSQSNRFVGTPNSEKYFMYNQKITKLLEKEIKQREIQMWDLWNELKNKEINKSDEDGADDVGTDEYFEEGGWGDEEYPEDDEE